MTQMYNLGIVETFLANCCSKALGRITLLWSENYVRLIIPEIIWSVLTTLLTIISVYLFFFWYIKCWGTGFDLEGIFFGRVWTSKELTFLLDASKCCPEWLLKESIRGRRPNVRLVLLKVQLLLDKGQRYCQNKASPRH